MSDCQDSAAHPNSARYCDQIGWKALRGLLWHSVVGLDVGVGFAVELGPGVGPVSWTMVVLVGVGVGAEGGGVGVPSVQSLR